VYSNDRIDYFDDGGRIKGVAESRGGGITGVAVVCLTYVRDE
jgi:hypothetical protein